MDIYPHILSFLTAAAASNIIVTVAEMIIKGSVLLRRFISRPPKILFPLRIRLGFIRGSQIDEKEGERGERLNGMRGLFLNAMKFCNLLLP